MDRSFKAAAEALAELDGVATGQAAQLRVAGWDLDGISVLPAPAMIQAALVNALLRANVPRGMLNLGPSAVSVVPAQLAETDSRLVAPLGEK